MYHICSAECQIQFLSGKESDDGKVRLFAKPPLSRRGELGNAVRPRFGGVDQRDHRSRRERAFDLAEAGHHRAGLPRQRQGGQRGFTETDADAFGQIRLDLHGNTEAAGEQSPPLRRPYIVSLRR